MQPRTKWLVAAGVAAVAVLALSGVGIAAEDDEQLSGETREKAEAAALEHTGGGTVTDTEAGDDGASYGVEVMKQDGSQVEVQLDQAFKVTGAEADDDGPEDDD